jgi:hypothetical protein
LRQRFGLRTVIAAIAVLGAFVSASCASHSSSKTQVTAITGIPVYPNATIVGVNSDALAIYRSADSYREVADWYSAHMPRGTQSSRDDARSEATFAVFSPSDTKTVHVEMSDGTVRITMTDVKSGPGLPTGR